MLEKFFNIVFGGSLATTRSKIWIILLSYKGCNYLTGYDTKVNTSLEQVRAFPVFKDICGPMQDTFSLFGLLTWLGALQKNLGSPRWKLG